MNSQICWDEECANLSHFFTAEIKMTACFKLNMIYIYIYCWYNIYSNTSFMESIKKRIW